MLVTKEKLAGPNSDARRSAPAPGPRAALHPAARAATGRGARALLGLHHIRGPLLLAVARVRIAGFENNTQNMRESSRFFPVTGRLVIVWQK